MMHGVKRLAGWFTPQVCLAVGMTALCLLAEPPVASAQPRLPDPPRAGDAARPLPSAQETFAELLERTRKGVVTVEQGGRVLGVGTVLAGDGRVLTALSGLNGLDAVDIRYADGAVARSRVVHKEKAWDLALLAPQTGQPGQPPRRTEGLLASDLEPAQGAALTAFVASHGRPTVVPAAFRGTVDARTREGELLPAALDLDLKGSHPSAGTPVLDTNGAVVGILVKACRAASAEPSPPPASPPTSAQRSAPPCSPVVVAAPIRSIRSFLARVPTTAAAASPWLGIRGEPEVNGHVRGVRILAVAPSSPAEKAGLRANPNRGLSDVIVAVDGQPVDTPERLAEAIAKHAVGETVKLLVYSGERFKELDVVLRAP